MPYGDPSSARFQRYGPSNSQMRNNPGMGRSAGQSQARIMDRYYGDGSYWGDMGKKVGKWGSRIAGAASGAMGGIAAGEGIASIPLGVAGAFEGWDKGAAMSKAAGWGNYRVTNDLIQGGTRGSAPVYHASPHADEMGDVIISNRELVKILKSSDISKGFKEEQFTLNPVDEIFHHLRITANQYEQYEFLGLMFEYVPMTGEGGSNQLGVIGMAADYDPAQKRTFVDIDSLMRYKGAVTTKPSQPMLFGIECDPDKRPVKTMYTRDEVDRPKSLTDLGTFFFASEGIDGESQTLGQLWITYTCKLRNIKPTLFPPLPLDRFVHQYVSAGDTMYDPSSSQVLVGTLVTPHVTAAESRSITYKFRNTTPKGAVFMVMVTYSNTSNSLDDTQIEFVSLNGLEYVKIPSFRGNTTNSFQSSATNDDNKGVLFFKVRITGVDSNNNATDNVVFNLRKKTGSTNVYWNVAVTRCDVTADSTAAEPLLI
jgi:hypothetical protein